MEPTFDITGTNLAKAATPATSNSTVGGAMTDKGIVSSNITSPYYKASEPSVVSDSNIREKVIPNLQTRANQLIGAVQPIQRDGNGNPILTTGKTDNQGKAVIDENKSYDSNLTLPPEYADLYKGITDQANMSIEEDPRYAPSLKLINDARSQNDATYNSTLDSITKGYTNLINTTKNAQDSQSRALAGALRMGGSRHAPVSTGAIMDAKFNSDIQALSELQDKETQMVSQAQTSRANRNFELLGKQLDLIEKKRTEKNDLATKIQDSLIKQNQENRQKTIQSTRDAAVASLLNQGVTDPSTILDYLNHDDQGNVTGDFTAKEISDTLKSISPDGDLAKLSGATRDFFILKGHNQLPANIAALPEDQQLMSYVHAQKVAATTPASASTNKITLSEAKGKGLPISTVGMSEKDIADSLQDSNPPHWFIEKLNTEKGITVLPAIAQQTWESYRKGFLEVQSKTKVPAVTIGAVKALRAKGANEQKVNDFITFSGYDPSDEAFNE